MQDIDFSRYYRRQRRPFPGQETPENKGGRMPVNKVSLYLAIAFSSLAIGFIGGTQLQKSKMTREIEGKIVPDSIATANVANAEEKVTETVHTTRTEEQPPVNTLVKEGQGSYVILANTFSNQNEATLAGLNLKRSGHKAFISRNGKRVKLYVGPIESKAEGYEVLGKLKKNPEFSGAILYNYKK